MIECMTSIFEILLSMTLPLKWLSWEFSTNILMNNRYMIIFIDLQEEETLTSSNNT